MKKVRATTARSCPICGKEYTDYPAISRKDNATEICPDCGTMEALERAGIDKDQMNKVRMFFTYMKK